MKRILLIFILLLMGTACSAANDQSEIVVALDGSGQFRSIQDAINSIPNDNAKTVVIVIRKGVYHEKLFIQKSFVTLVGENRDSTRIVYAELRKNWNKDHQGSDWGTATVNIDSTVTDLTLANLTVYNNYGALYGDHDHQFAVWGSGTRIIIVNCNIIADGGDTLSLWNRPDGMYYHANCYFEGWVDFVCPRGWCYITDSRFYGHNFSAAIWHDGSRNKDQKFVIRYSYFDGIPGFPLGRHHRDGQFYLLDCIFARNMADRPIYFPKSPNAVPWVWGDRQYYYNSHHEGGDFGWHRDNLVTAEGSPTPEQITPEWTFAGKWSPEETMSPVLPFVSLPKPRNAMYGVKGPKVSLRWIPARKARTHIVYFGKEESPGLASSQSSSTFKVEKLEPHTTYYWRVDEVMAGDTLRGPPWHFTTE